MRKVVVLVALTTLVLAAAAWARPADRDGAFSGDGIAEVDGGADTRFRDIAALPGGDIVAVGRAPFVGAFPLPPAVAARFGSDGEPRAAIRRLDLFGPDATAPGVVADSQGRALVAVDSGAGQVALTRLTGATLATDTTYGRNGVSSTGNIDPDASTFVGLGITADDRPVVVATHFDNGAFTTTILRWTAAGILDSSFGTSGRIVLADNRVASDMLVDPAGRVVLARPAGSVLRITDTAPGTAFAVPDAVRTTGMQVALAGTDLLVAGAVDAGSATEVRVVKLNDAGAADTTFGTRTATVAGYEPSGGPRDLLALADGRILTTLGVRAPTAGAPLRVGLVRLNADGTPDSTFAAGGGGHYVVDDLGSTTRVADPLGGSIPLANDQFAIAGRTELAGDDANDRAFVARYGVPGLPPAVSLSRSYRAIGNPPTVRAYARPGQPVDFTASATDPDGTIASYAWDPDGDGVFTDEGPSPTFSASYPTAGVRQAAVRVRDSGGLTSTASATVSVVLNEKPALTIRRGYDADPQGMPTTFSADRAVTFKASATDADGNVKRIQLDLDGQGGFEVDGATGTRTFDTPGTAIVNVRATDDEGFTTDERIELTITDPPCSGVKEVVIGRLRALAQGWQQVVDNAGQADEKVTYTACTPSPPQYLSLTQQLAPDDQFDLPSLADRPSVNGIYFVNPDLLQIVKRQNEKPRVVWAASQIDVPAPGGTRFRLVDGQASGSWKLEDNTLKNVATFNAVFGGLKVGRLGTGGTIPLPAAGQAKFSIFPQLPAVFGAVTASTPFEWTTNVPAGRQLPLADCFNVSGASLPGLDFLPGDQGVRICRRANDPDAYDFSVKIDLAAFDLPAFDGLPKLRASGGINDGELTGIAAELDPIPPAPTGLPLIGPIFLQSVNFQLVLDESSLVDLGCVNGVGVDIISNQRARDLNLQLARDAGLTGAKLEQFRKLGEKLFPDFRVDYGTPSSALCGGAKFYAGFNPVRLAEGEISLGVVEYSDDRPDAFRVLGTAEIIEVFDGEAELSVYSKGFAEMRAEFRATFADLIRLTGDLLLQVDAPSGRYNAEAGIEGCIIPVDICAGIRALISNRGIGACLALSFLGADWNPGAIIEYGEGATPYFSGCDLGDIRVTFNSGESSTIITPGIFPEERAASWTRPPVAAQIAQREKHQQTITVKPGMPGVYIAVRGQDDQLAKFTLRGPNGERISADGASDPSTPTIMRNLLVGNDEKLGVTHVLIGSPAAGKWTLTPDAGSVPIVEVVGADGLDKPEVKAKVTGDGHQRVLRYEVEPRKGQVVSFREDGPTGKQFLGRAKGAKGELAFDTAVGNAEGRTIVAIVEQDGMLRDELEVARYRAPATQPAGRIARTIVRRKGSKVTLRWLPSSGAVSYQVGARLSDGRMVARETKARKLVLTRVAKQTTGTFTVAGIDAVGEPGRDKRAVLKVAKKPPKKKKKKRG